jgi:hypothetical protein
MIHKLIQYIDQPLRLACDGQCSKAWGINLRPKNALSDDPDNYEFLADSELEIAPIDPGTYEGNDAKPCTDDQRLNKWCARECERSTMVPEDWPLAEIALPGYSQRRKNISDEH